MAQDVFTAIVGLSWLVVAGRIPVDMLLCLFRPVSCMGVLLFQLLAQFSVALGSHVAILLCEFGNI